MKREEAERKIVNELIENSRQSFRQLAKKTGMSAVTVMNRVHELEKKGIIKGYSAVVDYEKIGYDFLAMIFVKVQKGQFRQAAEKIASHRNVSAVYDLTGETDSLVISRFQSRRSLDEFLKKIQSYDFIERTTTALVLSTLKEELMKI